ncbi:rhodanese-like domain-containing protein [Denitratisoma oestradiolicum]|uniref:Sulfurtransferase n=1 Tax=Denitratisoma oestradiolicum TaxID=311182 RepID=A0A6S6Y4Q7_9PROT|nr:rhodanese-like domain-containing protein [Denitratisoma oestradiolicum]TWO80519.1 sulfurtransferase [Denitratisoma oestradiolicum]CAB1367588.1 Sulfurtransferase [Denitratisoma oestradiolicum]
MWEFIQQNIFLVALAAVSGGMLLYPLLRGGGAGGLSAAEATLKINREDAVVIDVREADEWAKGRIPGARHIPAGQLEKRLGEIEKLKARPVIVCCAGGGRSATACGVLKKAGFTQVFNLDGGMGSWAEANLPITAK